MSLVIADPDLKGGEWTGLFMCKVIVKEGVVISFSIHPDFEYTLVPGGLVYNQTKRDDG